MKLRDKINRNLRRRIRRIQGESHSARLARFHLRNRLASGLLGHAPASLPTPSLKRKEPRL